MSQTEYMLDTETCIHLINRHPKVRRQARPTQCAISVIVFGELELAACRSDRADLISAFTDRISIVDLERGIGGVYAELRAYMEREEKVVRPNGLWTAAHASMLGRTLVVMKPQVYAGIPELKVTTWLGD